MATLRTALKKRKERQDVSSYDALVATPGDLVAGIKLPANAFLQVSSAVVITPSLVLDIGSREIGVPDLLADVKYPIGFFEKDVTVTVKGALPGLLSLFIESGLDKTALIGTG